MCHVCLRLIFWVHVPPSSIPFEEVEAIAIRDGFECGGI